MPTSHKPQPLRSFPQTVVDALEAGARVTGPNLVAAYVEDLEAKDFGVDYFLAQEMQRRGYRDPNTCELTAKGRKAARAARRARNA